METSRRILLHGSWQTRNIGDIAHTPGFLALVRETLPDCEIHLWPCEINRGVREMLLANFPGLVIADTDEALRNSFARCGLLVNGSGPWCDLDAVERWRRETGKPYGFYGVSISQPWTERLRENLSAAAFVFCRDTISVHFLRTQAVPCPRIEFAPDSTFFLRLQSSGAGAAFRRENGLEPGKFVCVIPRLRWTPADFDENDFRWTDARREAVSRQAVEDDMAKLREFVCHVVSATDLKVLVCPEMTYQVPMGRRFLYEPLPAAVKRQVVLRREYWITDEAMDVYQAAHSLVSMEMHSPIMFVALGRPAILLRQAEDTWKGQMWRDLGLQKWILELDNTSPAEIAEVFDAIAKDYPAARQKVADAMRIARQTAKKAIDYIYNIL